MRHRPYRLGTVTQGAVVADPANAVGAYTETRTYTIAIPDVDSVECEIARKEPAVTEVGTMVMASGADGSNFPGGTSGIETWFTDLTNAGWRIIQIRWPSGWLKTTGTKAVGSAYLAGRVATVVRHIHQNWVTVDNLILTGGSGGASQMSYCLSHYNLGSLAKSIINIGGPPHASLYDLCVGDVTLVGDVNNRNQVDDTYENTGTQGPCNLQNATDWGSTWAFDSIMGGSLSWPKPRYVWGSGDTTVAPAQGALIADRQPNARRAYPEGASHNAISDAKGRGAVEAFLYDRPVVRQAKLGQAATATGVTATLGRAAVAGNLLIVTHRAGTGTANTTPPTGFVNASDGVTTAEVGVTGGSSMQIYWKVAAGGETGITASTSASVAQAIDVLEVEYPGASWTVDEVAVASSNSVTTLTVGPTGVPSAAMGFAAAGLSVSGGPGSVVTDWTNGYVPQTASSADRLYSAARGLHAAAAQSTALTWTTARNAGAVLAVFTP